MRDFDLLQVRSDTISGATLRGGVGVALVTGVTLVTTGLDLFGVLVEGLRRNMGDIIVLQLSEEVEVAGESFRAEAATAPGPPFWGFIVGMSEC